VKQDTYYELIAGFQQRYERETAEDGIIKNTNYLLNKWKKKTS